MHHKQISRLLVTALFIILSATGFAHADMIEYDFTIKYLEETTGTNPYGLSLGDTVTVEVTYDPLQGDQSEPGLSMHSAFTTDSSYDSTFDFSLAFGSSTYTGADDIDWPAFPIVTFNTADWSINTMDFWVIDDTLSSWVRIEMPTINGELVLTAGSQSTSTDEWELSSVPEPGTMILFGFGLLSLVGIARKSND